MEKGIGNWSFFFSSKHAFPLISPPLSLRNLHACEVVLQLLKKENSFYIEI